MPKALLPKEVQALFLEAVTEIVKNAMSKEAVALDIMDLLDGVYMSGPAGVALPPFALIPNEGADDQAFRVSKGQDFYSEPPDVLDCNIAPGIGKELGRTMFKSKPPKGPKMPSKLEQAFEGYGQPPKPHPGTDWPPDIKMQEHQPVQSLAVYEYQAPFALDSNWNPIQMPKTTIYHSQQFSMRHTFPEQMFKGIAASTAADHYMQDAVHKIAEELWKAGMFQVREVPKTDPSLSPYDSAYTKTYEVSMFFLLPPQPFPKPY